MTGTPEDEAAIRSLFELQGEAWKAADAERFASAFAEDADFINIRAHTLRGREEIARHHAQIFDTVYRGATVTLGELRIRFLRPDVATIEAASSVQMAAGERHAHMLAVAQKTDGLWLIQALHNMVPFTPPNP